MENVGKVNYAKIKLQGITVVAGYNDTGKTTVLRAADLMMKTNHNLTEHIAEERIRSIYSLFLRQEAFLMSMALTNCRLSLWRIWQRRSAVRI